MGPQPASHPDGSGDSVPALSETQLDALREVVTIGAGHAATALSQMTRHRIMISVPTVKLSRIETILRSVAPDEERVTNVSMRMLGDLTGATMFMTPTPGARHLCDLLLARQLGTTTSFDALARSSLKEAGNILGGAFMTALSAFTELLLLPSVPTFISDLPAAVVAQARATAEGNLDVALWVQTEIYSPANGQGTDGKRLPGHLLFFPDAESLNKLFQILRVA